MSLYPLLMLLQADALRARGRLVEAIGTYRSVVSIQPELVSASNGLGIALMEAGENALAVDALRQAVDQAPSFAVAYNNLGTALKNLGRLDEALEAFQTSLRLRPHAFTVHNNLGTLLKDCGLLTEAIASFREALRLEPRAAAAHSNLLYTLYFHPDYTARAIYDEHVRWDEQHARALTAKAPSHTNVRDPQRRLRIGYLSPDFRHHVQAHFTLPIIKSHNREKFEIFCYSNARRADEVTQHFARHVDGWRNIASATDDVVAQRIRGDGVDLLVDLTMHMAGGRPLVFARKPAPLQVAWLAYPGTTGMSAMDYRLTDPHLDPPDGPSGPYVETSITLPQTFWCYDPMAAEPRVSDLPARTAGHITFCCFNSFCKINIHVLKLWTRVLHKVPASRLMILAPPGAHRQRVLDVFAHSSIAADRIAFVEPRPRLEYLALYNQADIALDTFPANGHTTTLDALWMGLPVVTLEGETAISRGAKSILHNVGRPGWVAQDESAYVRKVHALADDVASLAAERAQLRAQVRRSPVVDAPRFTRNLEEAYRTMWQRWCAS